MAFPTPQINPIHNNSKLKPWGHLGRFMTIGHVVFTLVNPEYVVSWPVLSCLHPVLWWKLVSTGVSTQPKEPGGLGPGLSWNVLSLIFLSCCQVLPLDLSSLPLTLESQRPKPPPASDSPKAVCRCSLSEANTVSLTQFYLPSLSVCPSTHGLSLNMMPKYVLTSTKQGGHLYYSPDLVSALPDLGVGTS